VKERSDSSPEPVAFEWDVGNVDKNWEKHGVRASECEEVFFNQPLLVHDDPRHSTNESRHLALGQTHAGRGLCVAFTQRGDRIRVISARNMSRRERRSYAEAQTDS
jgi:hypothetical protein